MKLTSTVAFIILLSAVVESGIYKRETSNCNRLADCLKNVVKNKIKCDCSPDEIKIMADYNKCLINKKIPTRCPNVSDLCISNEEPDCFYDEERCYKQFYGSFTAKEKEDLAKADGECEAEITSKYNSGQ